jgi:hydroxypyruvate reductase
VELVTEPLTGEASRLGQEFASRTRAAAERIEGRFCLAAGGESTVTLNGLGRGGRNQELALAAVRPLAGLKDVMLISIATDGEDGPTDAAGAVVTGETLHRAEQLGLNPEAALRENDSYPFFEALGDLIRTGPTGTNVNDLVLMLRV